jgi:cation diffusion facilitator family transporter
VEKTGMPPPAAAPDLARFAWLSIITAVTTITLKAGAFLLTGSVGLLSDAAESLVNLLAAVVALYALRVAMRPADEEHHFGHGKAEYFSAGVEGLMIFIAAGFIMVSAVRRFLDPIPLEELGPGLTISTIAAVANGVVGWYLLRNGRSFRSAALIADGKHLLTDVWTSAGVIVGVLMVGLTGWQRLDPVIAAVVGANIAVAGYRLVHESVTALLDAALPAEDRAVMNQVLDEWRTAEVDITEVRTRVSGRHRFVTLTVLVPGDWTVERGHELTDQIESAIARGLPDTLVQSHLEPNHRPRRKRKTIEPSGPSERT